jgi:hypothetical protein
MAKGGVEIVAPHQNHHPATEPDAFGVSGRAIDGLRRLHEFVGFALGFFGRFGQRGGICCGTLGRLILGPEVAALGKRASNTDQEYQPGYGEVMQNRIFDLEYPSTHKFSDFAPARPRPLV